MLRKPIRILGLDVPFSISVGGQIVFNRIDKDISMNWDVAPEVGPAFMPDPFPFGVSATAGPLLGWFSSEAQQVTTGDSSIMSATVAARDAYSAAIIRPSLGTLPDSRYGVRPVTVYGGKGFGGGYASLGTGISRSICEKSINVYDLIGK